MSAITVTRQVHFATRTRGRRALVEGPRSVPAVTAEGRVPRVARLMALAIHLEGLMARGAIRHQAEAAMVGQVTRARMTQVMNLLLLAPDIRLEILGLPRVSAGRDPITERHVRVLAAMPDWGEQRRVWKSMTRGRKSN